MIFEGPGELQGVPGELVRSAGGARERSLEHLGHPGSAGGDLRASERAQNRFLRTKKSASRDPKDVRKWISGIFFRDDVFFAHQDFERVDKKVL